MIPEYRLTAENVRRQMMETLTEHLSLQANGYRCTTDPGIDDRIGHVELDTGKVYQRRPGPDEYLGRVELDTGKVYRHVPADFDEYLGKVDGKGRMYQHESLAPDAYMGKISAFISFAHAGAGFLLLVLPAYESRE